MEYEIVKRIVLLSLLAGLNSTIAYADSLKDQTAQLIRDRGFWCAGSVTIAAKPFGSSANKSLYHVFCDSGAENANYEMEIGRDGSYVAIREE
jgi:hypothetical protein